MTERSDWERFFDACAPNYLKWSFTKATDVEVDFLCRELALPVGGSILDIGCGTGRHAVALAKRGYRVTGVDLSRGMLSEADGAARSAGVTVEFVHADATRYHADHTFDAVICLCEGAFSLIGAGDDPWEHDLAILRSAHDALRRGGRFILTALNGLRMVRVATPDDVAAGRFDPMSVTEIGQSETEPGGVMMFDAPLRQRGYVPTELMLMMRMADLRVDHVWGGTAGRWGERPVDLDEIELMVVATRT